MLAIILVVLLTTPQHVMNDAISQNLIKFISGIVKNTFYTGNRCFFYLSDNSEMSQYVERVLLISNLQLVALPLICNSNFSETWSKCDGYIIIAKEESMMEQLFAQKRNQRFLFKPHEPILVFHLGWENFQRFPYNFAINILGLDLIIVQGFITSLNERLWDKQNEVRGKIVVRSLQRNKTLASWETGDESLIRSENFKQTDWRPTFYGEYKFRIAYINYFPFTMHDNAKGLYGGIEYNIIKEVTKNWPIEFIYRELNTETEVSTFIMLLNDTVNGEVDVSLCAHWQSDVLKYKGDVTIPYTQLCITFLVPKPQLLSNLIFQPFQLSLWILVAVTVSVLGYFMYLIAKCFKFMGIRSKYLDRYFGCLCIMRIVTSGSLTKYPTGTKTVFRYILTPWSITCLLLATAYSAGFTTSLTYPRYTKPVNTIKDIVDQKLRWLHYSNYFRDFFESSSNSMWEKLPSLFTLLGSVSLRNSLIKTNKFALIAECLPEGAICDTDLFDDYGKTHLKVLQDCFEIDPVVMAFSPYSPFQKIFNQNVFRFVEHGLIQFWYSQITSSAEYTYMSNFYTPYVRQFKPKGLNMERLRGAFVVLLFGFGTAMLCFIFEICTHNTWKYYSGFKKIRAKKYS